MPNQRWPIQSADGAFDSYLAVPEGDGPLPAVVVIQEIFGINAVMRQVCESLAGLGFLACCPDLFWRLEPGIELTDKTPDEWKTALDYMTRFDIDKGVTDIQSTINQLRGRADCTGKVGTVGYCLGGHLAFLTATRTDVDAAVGYYGINLQARLGESIERPLMLHIAHGDSYTPPEARDQIVAALRAHPRVTLYVYAGRDHAFARPGGEHFHREDAGQANDRTAEFLRANLV